MNIVTIVKTVDLEPLKSALCERKPEYLIVSEETMKFLEPKMPEHFSGKSYSAFYGIPIAICNAVPFGRVDMVD